MCAPAAALPLIGLGISGTGTALQYFEAKGQSARNQFEQEQFRLKNQISVQEATRLSLADLRERDIEEMLASAFEANEIRRDMDSAASTAIVAAAEAGVSGDSVEALLTDIARRGQRNLDVVEINSGIVSAQLYRERQAAIARGISQVNAVQPIHYESPSPLVPLIDLGLQTLDTYDRLEDRKARQRAPINGQSY